MYKAKNLRDQSVEELKVMYDQSCKELYELNSQLKSQKNREKPHQTRHVRKDIARLLTVMTAKKTAI